MKRHILLAILAVLGACDSSTGSNNDGFKPDPVIHSLPTSENSAPLCTDADVVNLVGGDLMASADRIVVGTVTNVEVIDEIVPDLDRCIPSSIAWTLRVMMQVEENLKGTGTTVEFNLSAREYGTWDAWPLRKVDGQWLPTDYGDSRLLVSDTLGWNAESGVQRGQELLVFLWDRQSYTPIYFPMAQRQEDGTFRFQADHFGCVKLPTDFLGSDLDTIKSSLAGQSAIDMDYMMPGSAGVISWCDDKNHTPPPDLDAGVDQ
ncbi:MAG: hypothetical protein R3E66_06475 [bacterium]